MAIKKPMVMVDANVYVNGKHHLGTSKSVKTPKIARGKVEQVSGGFKRSVSNGVFEELEGEFGLNEYSQAVMSLLRASEEGEEVEVYIKGNITVGGKRKLAEARWRGLYDIEDGEWKAGEEVERKVSAKLHYAQLIVDGYEEYRLDTDNMIGVVDGVDLLEVDRKNLM